MIMMATTVMKKSHSKKPKLDKEPAEPWRKHHTRFISKLDGKPLLCDTPEMDPQKNRPIRCRQRNAEDCHIPNDADVLTSIPYLSSSPNKEEVESFC